MSRCPWSSVPLTALALLVVGCGREARQGAATARADSATTTPAGPADFRAPGSAAMAARAPATFRAPFETSQGAFVIEVQRDWAPLGADPFYNLVKSGYYDGVRFFRVIPGFMAQFGIHGDTGVTTAWRSRVIADDPVRRTNGRGMVTYATAGPGTRTTQIFINFGDNNRLDASGLRPSGKWSRGWKS